MPGEPVSSPLTPEERWRPPNQTEDLVNRVIALANLGNSVDDGVAEQAEKELREMPIGDLSWAILVLAGRRNHGQ